MAPRMLSPAEWALRSGVCNHCTDIASVQQVLYTGRRPSGHPWYGALFCWTCWHVLIDSHPPEDPELLCVRIATEPEPEKAEEPEQAEELEQAEEQRPEQTAEARRRAEGGGPEPEQGQEKRKRGRALAEGPTEPGRGGTGARRRVYDVRAGVCYVLCSLRV